MKYSQFFLLLLIILGNSCKKSTETTPLDGDWRLVKVIDQRTQTEITPTPNNSRVFLLNIEGYKFSGNTFRNNFSLGSYTLSNGNEIRFGTYVRSELTEEAWGQTFFEVLNSCFVQSLYPCIPIYAEIKQDSMIWTNNITQYDLRFVRNN